VEGVNEMIPGHKLTNLELAESEYRNPVCRLHFTTVTPLWQHIGRGQDGIRKD